ncbi:hypothetical protein PROFUN_11273 [Planoprotostelium fungivorum]|uniref:Ankyrin repeat protein n=1 Tax=Planoprotostelium fungivorum TaxID=1890364 RepID=A0A2P6NAG1_9EUKA|nr:hypothetical protein PROFUN_11273 [Planoprotostelium fungivorum]
MVTQRIEKYNQRVPREIASQSAQSCPDTRHRSSSEHTSSLFQPAERRQMTNGHLTSYDITRDILHVVLNKDVEPWIRQSRNYYYSTCLAPNPQSHDTRRKQFTILRKTCKVWKDIGETSHLSYSLLNLPVDGFTDWLTDHDLYLAVTRCKVDSLRFLLGRTDLDRLDPYLGEPFSFALDELLWRRLRSSHVCSEKNDDATKRAARNNHTEIVRLLLFDPRVDVSAKKNDLIAMASNADHTEVVRMITSDLRVDPTIRANQAIVRASSADQTELVQLMG